MAERPPKLVAYESLLRQATRLRVCGLQSAGDLSDEPVWGELTGSTLPAAIELLAARLEVFDDEAVCECEPVCFYELYDGPRRLAVIEFHGAGHMMLRGVAAIFRFDQRDAIVRWLAARGIADPQREPG